MTWLVTAATGCPHRTNMPRQWDDSAVETMDGPAGGGPEDLLRDAAELAPQLVGLTLSEARDRAERSNLDLRVADGPIDFAIKFRRITVTARNGVVVTAFAG